MLIISIKTFTYCMAPAYNSLINYLFMNHLGTCTIQMINEHKCEDTVKIVSFLKMLPICKALRLSK